MHTKREPRVGGDPRVAVTAKKFDRATGKRTGIEVRTLRVGESVVFTAVAGQIVELKVLFSRAKGATTTELRLEVSDDGSSLPDSLGTHGTLA